MILKVMFPFSNFVGKTIGSIVPRLSPPYLPCCAEGSQFMLTCSIIELVNMLCQLDQFEHLSMPIVSSELMTVFETLNFNYNL